MINYIYKLFLTLNSTAWVVVIFGIKNDWGCIISLRISEFISSIVHWKEGNMFVVPPWMSNIFLLLIPIVLSLLSVPVACLLSPDNLDNCNDIEEASNNFLPTYLGYFFIGLGLEKLVHLIFVYSIIFIFTYVAQTQYFNPIYLLFGFRFYFVDTKKNTKIFLISHKRIRSPDRLDSLKLRRINDTTFIALEGKK